jgi:hypothetical protein
LRVEGGAASRGGAFFVVGCGEKDHHPHTPRGGLPPRGHPSPPASLENAACTGARWVEHA